MSLELDGERPVVFSAVVGGNSEESLGLNPIVVDGKVLLCAKEQLGPFLVVGQDSTYTPSKRAYAQIMNMQTACKLNDGKAKY